MTNEEIRDRLRAAFRTLLPTADEAQVYPLVPTALTSGKLYESYVLVVVCEKLRDNEGFDLRLVNSNYLSLKSAPGPINRQYPCIELRQGGSCVAELWTDVEFLTLSHWFEGGSPKRGDYHELDLAVVDPGLAGRPPHDRIWLGVECKNTGYHKRLLKEILGIRRELSLLQENQATHFRNWPRTTVPANPASCLMVFSSDPLVNEYARPGDTFGIDFVYEPLAP